MSQSSRSGSRSRIRRKSGNCATADFESSVISAYLCDLCYIFLATTVKRRDRRGTQRSQRDLV